MKTDFDKYIQEKVTETKENMDIYYNTRIKVFDEQLETYHDNKVRSFENIVNDAKTRVQSGIISQVTSETRETRETVIKEMQEKITSFKNQAVENVVENFNTLNEDYKKTMAEIENTYKLNVKQINNFQAYPNLQPTIENGHNSNSHTNDFNDYKNNYQTNNEIENHPNGQHTAPNGTVEGAAPQGENSQEADLSLDYLLTDTELILSKDETE